jgi:hypothetical protein
MIASPPSPSFEGSNEKQRYALVIDRFSDLQASELSYWPLLPSSVEPVRQYGDRSCLPLRDSSGFAPDSLLRPDHQAIDNGRERSTRRTTNATISIDRADEPRFSVGVMFVIGGVQRELIRR